MTSNRRYIPAVEDEAGDHCYACDGRGGDTSTQDPVGDGGGSETLFDACSNCIGANKCPGCMGAFDSAKYECLGGCGWDAADVYSCEDEWDYGCGPPE